MRQDSQALKRSLGGFSTKIHTVVDGEGLLGKWHFTVGKHHKEIGAEILLDGANLGL